MSEINFIKGAEEVSFAKEQIFAVENENHQQRCKIHKAMSMAFN